MSGGVAPRERIASLLPAAMVDDDVTRRFTAILDEVLDDLAARVESAPVHFDPGTAPPEFVRLLASWTNTPVPESEGGLGPIDHQLARRFVRASPALNRWRGTRRGLVMLMELATGGEVEVDDPAGVSLDGDPPASPEPGPVVIRIRDPRPGLRSVELDALARLQMPVGVEYEIRFEEREVGDG